MNNNKKVMFSGGILKDKTVELDMEFGDQVVNKEYIGNAPRNLRKVTIIKPDTLAPKNIRKGTDIGGVIGTHVEQIPTHRSVNLYMPTSNQVISNEGEFLIKLTIKKPATLIPENIKLNKSIGGVIGQCVPEEIDINKLQEKTIEASGKKDIVVTPDEGYYLTRVTIPVISASLNNDVRPLQYQTNAIRSGFQVRDIVGTGTRYKVTTITVTATTTDDDIEAELKAHPESDFIIDGANENITFIHGYIYRATIDGDIREHIQLR